MSGSGNECKPLASGDSSQRGRGDGEGAVLPRYSEWETTAFQATDAFCSSLLLLTLLFGMPSSIERLELTNAGAFAMLLSAVLLAGAYTRSLFSST